MRCAEHTTLLLRKYEASDSFICSEANIPKTMNMKAAKQPPASGKTTGTVNQGALKLKAAGEYLGGISVASIRRLINRNLLKPNRSLRHLIIPVSELDRFLREGQA